jgi:hypothetical protein
VFDGRTSYMYNVTVAVMKTRFFVNIAINR